jgi:hypothetical protein
MTLSYATKVLAEAAKRLFLKISHVAVGGLFCKLLFRVELSHHRAPSRAIDQKRVAIPKLRTTAMKTRRSAQNALS